LAYRQYNRFGRKKHGALCLHPGVMRSVLASASGIATVVTNMSGALPGDFIGRADVAAMPVRTGASSHKEDASRLFHLADQLGRAARAF
jgi:hypothetical protein